MPRAKTAPAGSPEVTTTIRMPSNSPAAQPENEEKPFFWQRVSEIPRERWGKDIELWIYRLEPKVRMASGERGYLDILTEPITPAYIQKRWGGGTFRILVLEKGKILYSLIEEIQGDPVYDRRREVPADGTAVAGGSPAMGGEFVKVLEQQNERLYEVLKTLQGAKNENPAIASAVDILTSAYKTGLTAVAAGNPGADDPTKQLDSVLKIAERIVSVRTGGGGGLTEAITLLKELGVFQKPKSLAEQLQEVKALGELMGGGSDATAAGAIKNPWLIALKMIEPHVPELLDALKTNNANAPARPNLRPGQPGRLQTVPHRPASPAAQPAAAAPAAAAHAHGGLDVVPREAADPAPAAASTAEVPGVASGLPEGEWTPEKQEQFDTNLKIQIVNMVRLGASGSAVAALLEDLKPDMAKDLARYPKNVIEDFFDKDPVLRLLIQDPRWDEVFADARDFLTEEDQEPVIN